MGDVAFVCVYGQLNSRVQVVPGDMFETIRDSLGNTFEGKANPRRTFRPKAEIDGQPVKKVKWIEGKEDRVVMPLEYKSTAQIYNAVIKRSDVSLTRKKKTIPLNLPERNADFRNFGKSCLRKKSAK